MIIEKMTNKHATVYDSATSTTAKFAIKQGKVFALMDMDELKYHNINSLQAVLRMGEYVQNQVAGKSHEP